MSDSTNTPETRSVATLRAEKCTISSRVDGTAGSLIVAAPNACTPQQILIHLRIPADEARHLAALFRNPTVPPCAISNGAACDSEKQRHVEIERKFLPTGIAYRAVGEPVRICQGFLRSEHHCVVRVRIKGSEAWLTIKGPTIGLSRHEYEYLLGQQEARDLLAVALEPDTSIIDKLRYIATDPQSGLTWEIDEFLGENQGLTVAEVELGSEIQEVVLPSWLAGATEVTGDPRYYNASLARLPFSRW